MKQTGIQKNLIAEWPLYLSFSGVFLWFFSCLLILFGNPDFANSIAFYGYWLLFIGLFCLALKLVTGQFNQNR